jgi:hypothetical protein
MAASDHLSAKQFNQAKVTRTLKAIGIGRYERIVSKKMKKARYSTYHAGVEYTPIDAATTAVKWRGNGNGSSDQALREKYHPRIEQALKEAGFQTTLHGDSIHIKH